MIIPDLLSWICLLAGSFFCIVGGIGLVRLPDFYSRMHGSGITDTLGAGLVLVGLMIQGGLTLVTVKLIMILVVLLLASPTATHAIAKAAFTAGVEPQLGQEEDAQ